MLTQHTDRHHCITRRAFVLGGIQVSLLSLLVGRIYYLQVIDSEKYRLLSDDNRINHHLIAPSRGKIFDRAGKILAANNQNFQIFLVAEQTPDVRQTLTHLSRIITLSSKTQERVLREVKQKRPFLPVMIRDHLTWEEVSEVGIHAYDLPGISIDEGEIRHYPFADPTAHLIGYVGSVSRSEIKKSPVLSLPGFQIGKTGIEKYYDTILRGTAGTRQVEVNAVGRPVRELHFEDGHPGSNLHLSIDIELQKFTQDRLNKEKSAAAVIMDIYTGEIYACASSPAFDPNLFSKTISPETWEALLSNPALPLINKAITGQYPPGSTFKMMTALAALEAGTIDHRTQFRCYGHLDLGNHRFHCWRKNGHGYVRLQKALTESCDVYFYEIARRTGIDKIAEMARRFGFGDVLDLDIQNEKPGLMPDKKWKLKHRGKSWQQGETLICAIGQGYVKSTPLQLVVMMARLVNGGLAVKPHLVRRLDDTPRASTNWPSIDINPTYLDLVMKGMKDTVNIKGGTAYNARIRKTGFQMGGKTGTAQVKRISLSDRKEGVQNKHLDWRLRHHALFVGYAPLQHPRYACSVIVEHGVSGGSSAAPIARDILFKAQTRKIVSSSPGAKT